MIFKDGQYVTGTDRSYQRSIYQIVSMDSFANWTVGVSASESEDIGVPMNGERAITLKFIGIKGDGIFRTLFAKDSESLPPLNRFELVEPRGPNQGFEKEFRHATGEELAEVGIYI